MKFKASQSPIWRDREAPAGITLERVYIGADPDGLGGFQIAVAHSSTPPKRDTLTGLFNRRRGRRQISLVIAVVHNGIAYLCGPDPQMATLQLPVSQAERSLQSVLEEPDVLAARQRFASFHKALETTRISGFTNSGLFASHHIRENVPNRSDWAMLAGRAAPMLYQRGQRLIEALGFHSKSGTGNTLVLSATTDAPQAVAVLLDESEQFDAKSPRFQLTPVAFGLSIAARQEVPWLLVLRKDQIRLYPGKDGVGVGQKGQTETFFEVDLATIDDEFAALLPLIFSASALEKNGTATELLNQSSRYATALGTRLRERIYDDVVPPLAKHIASQLPQIGLQVDTDGLATAYRLTLRVLFRLLFQAYAEDRQLLPSGRNERYDANSLKTIAQRDMETDESSFSPNATSIWFDLIQVWNAIDQGNPLWNVPAYNGGLFATDPNSNPEGSLIAKLSIPDSVLGPALKSLLVDITEDEVPGPVDFRSLSVREFGTIYEGLLESSLSLADSDLTTDKNDAWVPAKPGDEVKAPAGSVYFHSASGERKATGSYFTPKVVVDHLIERSITPTLNKHLEKIATYLVASDDARAAREFFNFRVADLAMGSGHFLVAAVDKIEAMMRSFLTEHEIPGVREELIRLAGVAKSALGSDQAAIAEVDEVSLLRRQIARRCVYGLDINPLAVELTRLAIWIHTFVPGLPMSNLDHGLVCADSLTGIGTVDEAVDALLVQDRPRKNIKKAEQDLDNGLEIELSEVNTPPESGYQTMVRVAIEKHLASTLPLLADVASASEATKSELQQSTQLLAEVRDAAEPARRIFDAAIARRIGQWQFQITLPEHVIRLSESTEPSNIVDSLNPAHMPVLFPEVFLRENPGFDVLVGNPPWQELTVEELRFWNRYFPGLIALSNSDQRKLISTYSDQRPDLLAMVEKERAEVQVVRNALIQGPYPGMGKGDPDLYKGFAWRNWQLLKGGGIFAAVFPRSLWVTQGSSPWRSEVFSGADVQVEMCRNDNEWMFEGLNPGWQVSLCTVAKRDLQSLKTDSTTIEVRGLFTDLESFQTTRNEPVRKLDQELLRNSDPELCLPSFKNGRELDLWGLLLEKPPLGNARETIRDDFGCAPATELHVTKDGTEKGLFSGSDDDWPVYNHLNISEFRLDPSAGVFARAPFEHVLKDQQEKRSALWKRKNSPFSIRSQSWNLSNESHPILNPRIVYRAIVHSSNPKKIWFALAPAKTLLTNAAPYLVFVDDDLMKQAYVLGVLNSGIVDWFGHLRVSLNMNFFILYTLPVPVFDNSNPLCTRIAEIAGALAITDDADFGGWERFGNTAVEGATRVELKAELDACVSLLFRIPDCLLDTVFDGVNPTRTALEDVVKFRNRLVKIHES